MALSFSGFKQNLFSLMKANETEDAAYELSFAGGSSGWSYGWVQFDLATGPAIGRTTFQNILGNAKDQNGNKIIPTDQEKTLFVAAQIRGGTGLSEAQITLIDAALNSTYGKQAIDDATSQYLDTVIEYADSWAAKPSTQVPDSDKPFLQSNLGKLWVCDCYNQGFVPVTKKPQQFESFLQGQAYRGYTKQGALSFDDILQVYLRQRQAVGNWPISDPLKRLAGVVTASGGYTPGSLDEAKGVVRAYTYYYVRNESQILATPARVDNLNAFRNAVNAPAEQLILANWKPEWGPCPSLGSYDDMLVGDDTANRNDAGDYQLNGRDGNDIIFGEGGDDIIEGGKGNDILLGGKGHDTYIYSIGDGNDRIIDEDKDGKIIIFDKKGTEIERKALGNFYKSGENEWKMPDGSTITVTHNSPWKVVLADGGTIELGDDFQSGDFGINLLDVPTAPTEFASTISGDLTPRDFDPVTDGVQMQLDALGNVICDPDPMPGRSDYLHDDAGNERIEGGDGNDFIYQGEGDDWVVGGAGRDGIGVQTGETSGNDIVEGGTGADIIYGGDGDDQLFAESKGETADLIAAGEISEGINEQGDIIGGGDGNDFIYGSDRNDALFGGKGEDLIVAGGGDDFISSAGDFDGTMVYTNGDNGTYTYESGPLFNWTCTIEQDGVSYQPVFTNLTYNDIGENDSSGDVVYAGAGNDFIFTAGGNDEIYAGAGNDVAFGWGGDDSIFGGDGDDVLMGDNSTDVLPIGMHGADYIDGGAGNDIISGGGNNDTLFGGDGDDQLQGDTGDDYLDGETGDDFLLGGDGNDQLMGGDGDDELQGGAGEDYLDGESGADKLYGDDGNDQIFGGDGNDLLEGDAGDDYLDGEAGNNILLGGDGNDQLMGGDGDDFLQGDAGDDYIDGGAGANTMLGGDGNDEIYGGDGNDNLQGGAGDDYLEGGDGNDELYGAAGSNVLVGGAGDDTYYLDLTNGTNVIYDDFSGEQNKIVIVNPVLDTEDLVYTWRDGGLYVTVSDPGGSGGSGGSGGGGTSWGSGLFIGSSYGGDIAYGSGGGSGGGGGSYGGLGGFGWGFGEGSVEGLSYADGVTGGAHGFPFPWDIDGFVFVDPVTGRRTRGSLRDPNDDDYRKARKATPPVRRDPLVLDLDGDGIESIRPNADTFFDHDGDGLAESTGWVDKDDGLLVLDRNGDGAITDGGELFGDDTVLKIGRKATNGFEALREFDVNKDGVIDAADPVFADLRVWRDLNGDSASAAEELLDLNSLGIKEIRLDSQAVNTPDENGNTVLRSGAFVLQDGSERTIADYALEANSKLTVDRNPVEIPEDITALPGLNGSGKVFDLRMAMVKDESGYLKGLVEDFANAPDIATRNQLMEQILYAWTGTEDIAGNSRGSFFDGRKLAVIEAFMGEPFVGVDGGPNPNANAAVNLDRIFNRIEETSYALLMMQTHLKDLYGQIQSVWDEASKRWTADLSGVTTTIKEALAADFESGKELLSDFARTFRVSNSTNTLAYLNFREAFVSDNPELGWAFDSGGLPVSSAGTNQAEAINNAGARYLWVSGGDGNDVIYASSLGDYIQNNTGDAVIVGGEGDDSILAGPGADIIDGGEGNDRLYGDIGNDTYIFRKGSGEDTIYDYDNTAGNCDTIYMGSSSPDDVVLKRIGDDLTLAIKDTDDRVTITGWFVGANLRVERVLFADGTEWNVDMMKQMALQGTEGDDVLTGYDTGDAIAGLGGNDRVYGGKGDDVLDGGTGNDYLEGGEGNDTYIFGRGYGQDTICDYDSTLGNTDVIRIKDALSSEVSFEVIGRDLVMEISGTDDRLTIKDWLEDNQHQIEQIVFGDGVTWDKDVIQSHLQAPSDSDDWLIGTAGNDALDGGGGNDHIYGLGGHDRLLGGEGDDYLYEDDGNNYIAGGSGSDILEADGGVNILEGGAGKDSLLLNGGENTINFGRGDGFDSISARLSSWQVLGDIVVFGEGITPEDLSIQVTRGETGYGGDYGGYYGGDYGGRLQLAIGIGNDEGMLIEGIPDDSGYGGYYGGDYGGGYGGTLGLADLSIKRFVFADGRELTLEQIISMADNGVIGNQSGSFFDDFLLGSVAPDTIYGGSGNEEIDARDNDDYLDGGDGDDAMSAGSGQDRVYGGNGNDVLAGCRGDDYLSGDAGNDVYVFNRGDGRDFIRNYPGSAYGDTDTVSFGTDITPADVLAYVDENGSVVLTICGSTDSIAIPWFDFYDDCNEKKGATIARVQFIDENGNARVFDLAGIVSALKDSLLDADETAQVSLFTEATAGYELIGATVAGGDYAVAYAQTGDLFATPAYIYGGSGDETINGRAGDDTIEGWHGNDILNGGEGDDTYIYNMGDGSDIIRDESTPLDPNSILFGPGITPEDIRLSHDLQNRLLVLAIGTTGDSLKLNNFDYRNPYGPHAIEYFRFDDGEVLTWDQMIDKGFDIVGTDDSDSLIGTGAVDRINGGAGDDTLAGGCANDILSGGEGDDTYLFSKEDGVDVIDDVASAYGGNTLVFGDGIVLADISNRLTYRGDTLIIRVGTNGDEVHLTGFDPQAADTGSRAVQSFRFADGTVLTYEDLVKNTFIIQGDTGDDELYGTNVSDRLYGYEGSDYLSGGAGNDTLTGGIGDDYLEGGDGSDTYVFNLGDGVDTISDSACLEEGNTILFGEGISKDDIRTHFDGTTLIIEYGNVGDAIQLLNYDYNEIDGSHVVENLEFADGSRLRLASLVDPATEGDDYIIGSVFDDSINGRGGNDYIDGGPDSDNLYGGSGDDELLGWDGDDMLVGGPGNDRLEGAAGYDTYHFNLGDGVDTVADAAEDGISNLITFGEGITRDDLTFLRDGNILTIRYGNFGDEVRIEGYDPTGEEGTRVFDAVQFIDGSTVTLRELMNRPPVAGEPVSDLTAVEEQGFVFQLPADTFVDADGDQLSYRASASGSDTLPAWLQFDPETRTFSGTPGNDDAGPVTVKVTATDPFGAAAEQSFVLNVENINDAPVVLTPLTDQTATQDQQFSFGIPADTFKDVDKGDVLSYSATLANGDPLPTWLAFDAATGAFSGIPANDDVGALAVVVTATDRAGSSAWSAFNLSVANVNDAPFVAVPLADQAAVEDQPFTFQVPGGTFNDIDAGDQLTYSAALANGDQLPAWLTFDPATGTFSGTPARGDSGALDVRVTATDLAGASAGDDFRLDIAPIPGETIIGTDANDTLIGTAGNDTLDGRGGQDSLAAGAGDDTLIYSADGRASFLGIAINLGSPGVVGSLAVELLNGKNLSYDRYDGGTGYDTIEGSGGSDVIALDKLLGQGPNIIDVERINAGDGNDVVDLTSYRYGYGDVVIDGGSGSDVLWANAGNDLLLGGAGNDKLDGGAGNDILQGGTGDDSIRDVLGNNVLDGGDGADVMSGGAGNELFIGGAGDDIIRTGRGADVISFNRGDGQDDVIASVGADNTVSLGGGIKYSDLSLCKSGYDLVLNTGGGDSITFKGWYISAGNRNVVTLQMIEEAAADFDPNGGDPLRDNKVELFDFAAMVNEFDQERCANPGLTSWALTSALTQFHLEGSDMEAMGGDLAYQYGKNGNLSGMGMTAAQDVLASGQFGSLPQALKPLTGLQEGMAHLG